MDRRQSLKIIALSTLSTSMLLEGCTPAVKEKEAPAPARSPIDRMAEEEEAYKKLAAETFFSPPEMATLALLADIIIPADDVSGSATQAGVPDFIEFMAKDRPELQVPLRGGLRWLDLRAARRFQKAFRECSAGQQLALVDEIAYPEKAAPEVQPGVAFFTLVRNLTASGFYTSEIGIKDIGYAGNRPNQWNGVPPDVLQQYGLSYTEKELRECVRFDG